MSRVLAAAAFLVSLGVPAARADWVEFHVDPSQSWVRIDGSNLGVYAGPGLGIPLATVETQLGRLAGVSAIPQAGLPAAADGRVTRIEGTLGGSLMPSAAAPTQILLGPYTTMLRLAPSGSWLPGLAEDRETPAGAQLAFAVGDGGFDPVVAVALRRTAFQLRVFLNVPQSGALASSGLTAHVQGGDLAVAAGSPALASADGSLVEEGYYLGSVAGGLFEQIGAGDQRITLPFQFAVPLGPSSFGGAPLTANLTVIGRIVATTTPVPEPHAPLALATAVLTLAALRRRSAP